MAASAFAPAARRRSHPRVVPPSARPARQGGSACAPRARCPPRCVRRARQGGINSRGCSPATSAPPAPSARQARRSARSAQLARPRRARGRQPVPSAARGASAPRLRRRHVCYAPTGASASDMAQPSARSAVRGGTAWRVQARPTARASVRLGASGGRGHATTGAAGRAHRDTTAAGAPPRISAMAPASPADTLAQAVRPRAPHAPRGDISGRRRRPSATRARTASTPRTHTLGMDPVRCVHAAA